MRHIDLFLVYIAAIPLAAVAAIAVIIVAINVRDSTASVVAAGLEASGATIVTGLAGTWGSRGCLDDPDSDPEDAHHALDELLDNDRPPPAPRLNLTDTEVFWRFADIVEAEKVAADKRMREER